MKLNPPSSKKLNKQILPHLNNEFNKEQSVTRNRLVLNLVDRTCIKSVRSIRIAFIIMSGFLLLLLLRCKTFIAFAASNKKKKVAVLFITILLVVLL